MPVVKTVGISLKSGSVVVRSINIKGWAGCALYLNLCANFTVKVL